MQVRLAIMAGALAFAAAHPAAAQNQRSLNVLFIASDDLNSHLACYGDAMVKTPNLDRLARMGVRFDRAYCQYPVCNASRTSVLSGRYPLTTQVLGNATPPRATLGDVAMLPEHFSQHGYFTARVGKIAHARFESAIRWDISEDAQRQRPEADDRAAPPARKAKARNKARAKATAGAEADVPFAWSANDHGDDQEPDGGTARRIVQIIDQHHDRPFFIAAGFHKPHIPHAAPRPYFDMYPVDRIRLPDEPTGHTDHIPRIAYPTMYYPDLTADQRKQIIQHYSACITFMDAQVGILLEAMDRLELWDDTIVVFWSDHGWHWGEHGGMWAKVSLMEESARVPMIVVAPGAKAGVVSSRLVELVGLYPTLVQMCGLPMPAGLEGRSFVPLLIEPNKPWPHVAHTTVTRGRELGFSVRDEQFTYIEWPDGSRQLYDQQSDPLQYRNLAAAPEQAERVRAMSGLIGAHRRKR